MYLTIVQVEVRPEYVQEFIIECEKNHLASILEPGNLRFDVLQNVNDACKFTLSEVYKTENDIAAHKLTPHYNEWRNNVEKMMARPRVGIKHNVLFPKQIQQWKTNL